MKSEMWFKVCSRLRLFLDFALLLIESKNFFTSLHIYIESTSNEIVKDNAHAKNNETRWTDMYWKVTATKNHMDFASWTEAFILEFVFIKYRNAKII